MDNTLSSKRYEPNLINLNDNTSQALAVKLTGTQKTVLEIGTSTGYVSKILKEHGNVVFGIEIDAEAGEIASEYCQKMIIGDVETLDLDDVFKSCFFDVILCGDVIEHLKNIPNLLKKIKKYLKPDGYLVVSLPNVCHGDVILNILLGDFHYSQQGLLDHTHLHFFGLKNIYSDFYEYGYEIQNLHKVEFEVGSTELKVEKEKIHPVLLEFITKLSDSNVYQYVFTAHPKAEINLHLVNEPDISLIFNQLIEESKLDLRFELANALENNAILAHDNILLKEDIQIKENDIFVLEMQLKNSKILIRIFKKSIQFLLQYCPDGTIRKVFLDSFIFWSGVLYYEGPIMCLKRIKKIFSRFNKKIII